MKKTYNEKNENEKNKNEKNKNNKNSKESNILNYTKMLIRIFSIVSIIIFIANRQLINAWYILVAFILTFYDVLLEKIFKIKLSNNVNMSLLALLFATQCLGSGFDFYGKFHWWDTVVHGISGTISFFVGLEIIKQINEKQNKKQNEKLTKENNKLPKIVEILFAFCFSCTIALFWELTEFAIDKFLGLNMQITKGLTGQDAIWDTIEDQLAATIGTILGVIIELIGIKISKNK